MPVQRPITAECIIEGGRRTLGAGADCGRGGRAVFAWFVVCLIALLRRHQVKGSQRSRVVNAPDRAGEHGGCQNARGLAEGLGFERALLPRAKCIRRLACTARQIGPRH